MSAPKILELSERGIWIYRDADSISSIKPFPLLNRVRPTKDSKLEAFFEKLGDDIEKHGCKSMRVSSFLDQFSVRKRTARNLEIVKGNLKSKGFYTLPQYSNELKTGSTLRIYNYPIIQLGELFDREKDLEDYVEQHELYKGLKIDTVERQHSPKGTKDKLDFRGTFEDTYAVIELKHRGGGKSAVEQVLRYAGLLMREFPDRKIRTILVTGIQNRETELAIRGMRPEQRHLFEWYLYKYHKDTNHFEFVRVKFAANDSETFCELRCPIHCVGNS